MVNAPTIEVANISMADSLILMVMALVVFGPRRLPQIGRQIGKLMYEFRKASNDFKFQMEEELRAAEEADRRKKEEAERQKRLAANPPAEIEASTTLTNEAPATTDSSYPYGGTYGEIAEAQEKTEATEPTIQPPSTGETVPAERPGAAGLDSETASEPVPPESDSSIASESLSEASAPAPVASEQIPVEKVIDVRDTAEEAEKTIEPAAHNG